MPPIDTETKELVWCGWPVNAWAEVDAEVVAEMVKRLAEIV